MSHAALVNSNDADSKIANAALFVRQPRTLYWLGLAVLFVGAVVEILGWPQAFSRSGGVVVILAIGCAAVTARASAEDRATALHKLKLGAIVAPGYGQWGAIHQLREDVARLRGDDASADDERRQAKNHFASAWRSEGIATDLASWSRTTAQRAQESFEVEAVLAMTGTFVATFGETYHLGRVAALLA